MTMISKNTVINTEYTNSFINSHIGKLPAADEKQLLQQAQDGDRRAQDILIKCYKPYIIDTVKNYVGRGVPENDLMQEANIGLLDAIGQFDFNRKCRLSSYAYWHILKRISCALREQGRTVKTPNSDWKHGDKALMTYIDDENSAPLPIDNDEDIKDYLMGLIEQSLWVLNDRERDVIMMLTPLGKGPKMTLREAGEELGVSLQYVDQIYKKALKKLRVQARQYRGEY